MSDMHEGPGQGDPEAPLRGNLRRNIRGILLFEFIWGLGMPFGLFVSMVPAYLTTLGSSKSLMGFVQSLWTALIPLQLLGGHFFASRGRVRAMMLFYVGGIGARLTYDVIAVFVPGMWAPSSTLGFFVVACAVYISLYVVGQSIYMGVLTDNIPRLRRGRVFGLRTLLLGVGGLLTGYVASRVLHRWPSPRNYQVSFLICDSIWTASTLSLLFLRDGGARESTPPAAGFFRSLLEKLKVLLANPNYRIFLFFHMLNCVAFNITSFVIPRAKEELHVPDGLLAWLGVVYLAVGAAFGPLLGRLADRAGYRSVAVLQSLMLLGCFAVAIPARSFAAVCGAYCLSSLVNASSQFVLVNMSVELCPSIGVTDLTALGGTLLLPVVATATPLAGRVIDATGSYPAALYIGATISVIALLGFALLVQEPRSGRLYTIKQIATR